MKINYLLSNKKKKNENLQIRFNKLTYNSLKEKAEKNNLSISAFARYIIIEYLEKIDNKLV